MFLRRHKLRMRSRVSGVFWPRIGWRRMSRYYWHRLHRMPGTSQGIAAGLAFGAAWGMTPFYGLHIIFAVTVAWVFGANLVAAAAGTFTANPWTAPPLWFGTYYAGSWMLGLEGRVSDPDFVHMFKELTEALLSLNMDMFGESIWPVFWPMIVGSVPFAGVVGLATYFCLEPIIRDMHFERDQRRSGAHKIKRET